MKCIVFSLLLALALGGCANPAVEYGSAVSAIRNMTFTKSFLKLFGDDCLVTAICYDGTYGKPGAALQVIHDRRYEISARCDLEYTFKYLACKQLSTWRIVVSEIKKSEMTSRGAATTFYGRTWRYTEQEWEKVMLSNEGFSALQLPAIPEASGDGIESVEKQYGRSSPRLGGTVGESR